MQDEFLVVAEPFRYEADPVKGSRFVASVAPAESAEAAEAYVGDVRGRDPGATHHCFAWRVGRPPERHRFSDAGEPGGSAGRPILQQIEGHGLTDTVVVVSRWFGGTKLGVGGLVRAYGGTAARALDRAPKRRVLLTRPLAIAFPYDCLPAVEALLAQHGLHPLDASWTETVRMRLEVPLRHLEALRRALTDRTSGRLVLDTPADDSSR